MWRDADTESYSTLAPPCGEECCALVWLRSNTQMSQMKATCLMNKVYKTRCAM